MLCRSAVKLPLPYRFQSCSDKHELRLILAYGRKAYPHAFKSLRHLHAVPGANQSKNNPFLADEPRKGPTDSDALESFIAWAVANGGVLVTCFAALCFRTCCSFEARTLEDAHSIYTKSRGSGVKGIGQQESKVAIFEAEGGDRGVLLLDVRAHFVCTILLTLFGLPSNWTTI